MDANYAVRKEVDPRKNPSIYWKEWVYEMDKIISGHCRDAQII